MADEIRGGIGSGNGFEGGVVRRTHARGHVKLGPRMWARVRREYAAGASAPWLSDRYGPSRRTIERRAKAGGWRRMDLAEAADAGLEAAEAEGALDPVAEPAIGKGLGMDGTAGAEAAAFAAALAGVDDKAREGAKVEALNRAVAWMMRGDASAAMGWARLAGALEGLAKGDGAEREVVDEAAQDAAMAVLCERLGLAPSPPLIPANAGTQITDAD